MSGTYETNQTHIKLKILFLWPILRLIKSKHSVSINLSINQSINQSIDISIYLFSVRVDWAGELVGGGGGDPQLRHQAHLRCAVQGPDQSCTGIHSTHSTTVVHTHDMLINSRAVSVDALFWDYLYILRIKKCFF